MKDDTSTSLSVRERNEIVKYSKEQFLKEFAPRTCMVKLHPVNSIEKAVKSDLNSLAKLTTQFDREFVINYLQLWIIDLNEFLNLTNKMSQEQIKDTAELIYLDNFNLNIADINIVFTNVKKGVYGQLYGSLDGMKLLTWFSEYKSKRLDWYYDNVSIHDHEGIKKHGLLKWKQLNENKL
jgi:hypothetical protein